MVRRYFPCVLAIGAASAAAIAGPSSVDLYVSSLSNNSATWTTNGPVNGVRAYSIGYSICNRSTTASVWNANTPNHPITTSNMFIVRDGMIRQVGMSWVFHEFFPLQQNCSGCVAGPSGTLGPGCFSTTSDASAGQQTRLLRRSWVNAATGQFVYPGDQTGDNSVIGKRLQVHTSDLETGYSNYFIEVQMIAPEEIGQEEKIYNNSFRRVTIVGPLQQPFPQDFTIDEPAIFAWRYFGNGAQQDPSVRIERVDIPNDGTVFLGSRAQNIGGGVWRYTYAIHNVNSDRSINRLAVGLNGAVAQNIQYFDPDYHSGEVYFDDEWDYDASHGANLYWFGPDYAFSGLGNVIRWGTLYTFQFEAAAIPLDGQAELRLYKPGVPSAVNAPATVSSGLFCPTDINGDASTDFGDLNLLLGAYGATGPETASDVDGDGEVGFSDLNLLLGQYGQGC